MAHVHAELMKKYAEDAAETDDMEYRRKPRTININGYEVPEPLREAPEVGASYFLVSLVDERGLANPAWSGDKFDERCLRAGITHATREAAELHARALLSFTEALS